jgi:integrase
MHIAKLQREMLAHFGANRDVRTIAVEDVEHFVKERAERYAPSTARNDITYLKSIFAKLHARGYIRANPAFDLRKPKALPREIYASERDVEEIVNAARKSTVFLPVLIALTTGCRVSEIISIEWDFVDLERGVIRIPAHLTKTRKPRVVPIHPAVREALLALPDREGRIIHIDRFAVLASFKTHVAEKVKLRATDGSRLHFHDLRHIYGSMLLNAGLDIHDVSKALGHSNTFITEQIYVQHARKDWSKDSKMLILGLVKIRSIDFW